MFLELAKVMDHSIDTSDFSASLALNVTGKKSNSGAEKTATYLRRLYGFDRQQPSFAAFVFFWKMADPAEKPLLAFLYAICHDDLLAESLAVLEASVPGEKLSVEFFEDTLQKNHPNHYSPNSTKSIAQNLASSWKQAGFIAGKVSISRTQPSISYRIACFAFLLAYIQGKRGDFIWSSLPVQALGLPESQLRNLAIECSKRDLMEYQHAGSVTTISFAALLNKIGINASKN